MSKPNPAFLAALLLLVIAILGGVTLMKGGFYIAKHEGDTLHMIDIVFRMARGQVPHIDFMTPIGALAFAPIALLVKQGLPIGQAVLWSQVLVALVLAVPTWWIALRRLPAALAALFGVSVMVLCLALVHGESEISVSISMHYNRWAWAMAYIAILGAVVPPADGRGWQLDGLFIGALVAGLALVKVTYFVAFAAPVALGLLMTRQRGTLLVALAAGAAVAAGVTLWLGTGFWEAYLADLRTVSASEHRAAPGLSFNNIVASPAYLGMSILALSAVVLLRQGKIGTGGLLVFLLLPGFAFVTYQNYGNDPQWLVLLSILVLALRPVSMVRNGWGWDTRGALGIVAAMLLAFAAPSFMNLAYSPFRHMGAEPERFSALLPHDPLNSDILTNKVRAHAVDATVQLDTVAGGFAAARSDAGREEPVIFKGETLPECSVEMGLPAFFDIIAQDVAGAGYAGRKLFSADIFGAYWLFADFQPLHGAAPWYYGGLAGYADADLLLVPLCPVSADLRRVIVKELEALGTDNLTEVRRTTSYILFDKS